MAGALELAAVLERLPVGVLHVDAGLTVRRANDAARALCPGVADVVGLRVEALLPVPALAAALRAALDGDPTRASYSVDLAAAPDGRPRAVRATVVGQVPASPGGSAEVVVVLEDTSVEAALLERHFSAELRFQALVGEALDAVLVADTTGVVEYANAAAELAFGASPRQLKGRALASLVAPGSGDAFAQRLAMAADAPHRQRCQLEFLGAGGRVFPAELTVSSHWLEHGPTWVVTVHDLTERRAAEAALEQSHAELKQLLELMPDPVAVVSDCAIVYANAALHRLLGWEPGTLTGREAEALVVPEERPGFPPWIVPAAPDCVAPGANEAHWLKRDGTVVAVERRAIALTNAGMPAWLVVARDLTSMRSLAARAEQLERMIAVGTLAAGVGHEINNPMAYVISNQAQLADGLDTLQGVAQRALACPGDGDAARQALADMAAYISELKEAVRDARQGAERVRRIVLGLRSFAHASTSARTRVAVAELLDGAVATCWEVLRHRARVVRDFRPAPDVEVDEERLRQALAALITNAAAAMDREPGELRLRAFCEGPTVVVEVEDTGVGMAPETLARAFEPFFTTRRVGDGMGLGLFSAQATVQAHGGRVTATSELGLGSTFRVELPAAPERAPRPPAPREKPPRRRVLLVDDEASIRASLTRALTPHHDVVPVSGGEEALALLGRGEHFDAVLCDVMMPEMSGLELLGQLRRAFPGLGRRVVLMTGGTTTERLHLELSDCDAVLLEKPFETHDALDAVARAQAEAA